MRVAIYVRVSTDEQASSAEAQESGALAWGAAVWALAWVLTACVERPVGRWITGAGKAP